MSKTSIATEQAPQAIGTYSQAIKAQGTTVYLSGQLPLVPETMQVIDGDFAEQTRQMFRNLQAVTQAAGGDLNHIVKLNIYLIDLSHFSTVNAVMEEFFTQPYPARAAIGVKALPLNCNVEADGVMVL